MKLRPHYNPKNELVAYEFKCPGCNGTHVFYVAHNNLIWQFNGNLEKPTFTPSLLNWWEKPQGTEIKRCHLVMTDGKINFCSDCTHSLSGQICEIPEIE